MLKLTPPYSKSVPRSKSLQRRKGRSQKMNNNKHSSKKNAKAQLWGGGASLPSLPREVEKMNFTKQKQRLLAIN